MKGKIQVIYPEGYSSIYVYFCEGKDGRFSFPVEHRYHLLILENEGDIIGREIEYDNVIDPPSLRFMD